MRTSIIKSWFVAITGAAVLAAGWRCLLLLVDALALGSVAPEFDPTRYHLGYMVRCCRNAQQFGVWIPLLAVAFCLALPVFWLCAKQLGSAWRIYHLSALALGGGSMAFFWLAQMIYRP